MGIGYGVSVESLDDAFIRHVDRAVHSVFHSGGPAALLVDFFPVCESTLLRCSPACCRVLNVVDWWVGAVKYLPAWMPGAGFKRLARSVRGSIRDMEYIPLRRVQQAMVRLPLPSSSFINTDGGVIRRVRVRGVGACGFGCCMCCGHGVCDVVYYGGWTDRLRARGSPRWRARSSRRRCARRAGS